MESSNFRNLGDWLIRRSTGAFGDFRMPVAIAIIRTERDNRNWVLGFSDDDVRRVLARYKEHVTYWKIEQEVVRRELTEFAEALGRNAQDVFTEFDHQQSQRLPADFFDGRPIGGHW